MGDFATSKMAGCDTGFVKIDETWTKEKALRKYSLHKNWYTKYITKVQNLKDLNDKAYDSRVEEKINKNITKAENTAACLGEVTCYLTQVGYDKWEDHQKEVDDMDKDVSALWKEISAKAHLRSQAARRNPLAAAPGPARDQDNSGKIKLVAELKPDVLSQDATAGELRTWVKKFEAYYLLGSNASQH